MFKAFFKNRQHAGELLFRKINKLADEKLMVVAIPNGGVEVVKPIYKNLKNSTFHLVISKKIPLIGAPYIGIGSISNNFEEVNHIRIDTLKLSQKIISQSRSITKRIIDHKEEIFSSHLLPNNSLYDKDVLLIDDGIASGFTIVAAIKEIKKLSPRRIIVAAPIIYAPTKKIINSMVSDLFYVEASNDKKFVVDKFYEDFDKVPDERVLNIINEM
ncbi:phosphoribosyltransferase family protein [Cytobacillus oceanisediminis]|uniref:Phosphoribosyltransferase domain-containing protein n=1 Tax=Cytobacillus oceanisediminis TaxID=665099 RepID=A0ABX3CJP5_9BACI|nr:phosphoribosyltransferase family protein [Cytobacillus oceanisediminis]OHX40714.1 hypothetical protein BBV17_29125 [Cytobacillus oceanisediminis]